MMPSKILRTLVGVSAVLLLSSGLVGCSAFDIHPTPEPATRGGDAIVVGVSGACLLYTSDAADE